MADRGRVPTPDRATHDELLESWKEIAAYLKRGVRTVRRWEKEEGLPVHRHAHKKLGTVYAYCSELDAWREGRRVQDLPANGPHRRGAVRTMIAVLPFECVASDGEQEYVADGLTEEMIGQLGRCNPERLGVIARTSVMRYRRTEKTIRRIAAELGVDYVVEGSVRQEADRIRVNARLIHGADQAQVWAGTYDRAVQNVLALEHDLARDVTHGVRLTLLPSQAHALNGDLTVSAEAYDAHLKGRYLLNGFTPDTVRRSVTFFRAAVEADPTYAPAYASLAEAWQLLSVWTDEPPAATLGPALQAAQRAQMLDPLLPEAYASLGLVTGSYLWMWDEAERHFRRALELNPGCSPARQWFAEYLADMGRVDEALAVVDRGIAHDPLSRSIHATRAFVLFMGRRFDEAVAAAELVLETDPGYPMALIRLGLARMEAGLHDDALSALRAAGAAAPELIDCLGLLGLAYGRAGRLDQAREVLAELERLACHRYVPAFLLGSVHLGLGAYDRALDLMEREYDARGWYMLLLNQGPQFDPLRDHPRFQALLRRMNFPAALR